MRTSERNCGGCRYWSEMIAMADERGVQAMCLSAISPQAGKYTTKRTTCKDWKSGHLGAVDDPPDYGEETRAAYAAEEEGQAS
jgi:hypothetical protein